MHTQKAVKKVPCDWHQAYISAALKAKGTNLSALSEANGYSRNNLRNALYRSYPKAEKIIADFLSVPLHELWPDRWTADGQRIRPRYAYLYINTDACSVAA